MTAPHWLGIAEASRAFAAKKLSPVELMTDLLARAARLDPRLNVYITLDADAALAQARQAQSDIAAGHLIGPLHGIPVGVKDIIDVAGLPTTAHSRLRADSIATEDAPCVAKLKRAGAIVIGKVATHEFALGGPSFDLPWPPARNPWNPAMHPGGSSSGSGAGLAAGLFPAALGTDTGGSIRNPASACGIVGMKPTYGRVSRRGVLPLAFTLDHVGPMTRTVADSALMLDSIAGHDPEDPGSANTKSGAFAHQLDRGVRGLRIGFVRHFHETDVPADPEVAAALEHVAKTLAAEGAEIRTVKLPNLREFAAVNRILLCSEAWTIHAPDLRTRPEAYGRLTRRRLLPGAFMGAGDYIQAQRRRRELIAQVEAVFRDVDILVCASSMDTACAIDDDAEVTRTYARQARTPFNVTGHPALAMMSGLASNGLPMSVQFAGPYFQETAVYRVAALWERASGVAQLHPAID